MADKLEFEWDPEKAEQVARDHGVTFEEARTVFFDRLAATTYDEDRSDDEERWVTIGTSEAERLLVVAHTQRESRIRLITARLATRLEKRTYEQVKDP